MNLSKTFRSLVLSILCLSFAVSHAQVTTVSSPDKNLTLSFQVNDGLPVYSVVYKGKTMLENSPLGLKTNEGDFSSGMKFLGKIEGNIDKNYSQDRIKHSEIHYIANRLTINLENAQQKQISIVFQVSNNDIAFRYELPAWGPTLSCVVEEEQTGFRFPAITTTFLSTMMDPMSGWARTTPSYETSYGADSPMRKQRPAREGYVFPGLFRVGDNGWVLVSETGVSSLYCGSHLNELSDDGVYTIGYPNPNQNNGFGSTGAAISLPGVTPWRTITVSDNLKPIVETTIPYDVVDPLYEPSQEYKFGKSTWSWIVWQDNSMNWDDQVQFIDLAAELKYEYILIDALWDTNIGRERMAELVKYAQSKGVDVFLWYNSNGGFNDAPQGPRNKMNTSVVRKHEMKWLREIGVKGLKIDFFGGDKQETMRLYEDILSDANDYGLMIIFHGTTLPRGWERMYPNFVGGEAVMASEMLVFNEGTRKAEAFNASLHPFIRNTVASMEFGGTFLNKYLVRSNKEKSPRYTTDAFQLATAVLFQSPLQMFAITPNNLTDVPAFQIDFMKTVPTTWDETVFIDGYPGRYAVIARRHGDRWYVAGVNAEKDALKLTIKLPMLSGKKVHFYNDDNNKTAYTKEIEIQKNGELQIEMQSGGGFVLSEPAQASFRVIEDGGTGPHSAIMLSETTLPTHTVFRPKNLNAFGTKEKLPVIAWGNGACANSPWEHVNFLSEVASHGFLVVAIGPMPQEGEKGSGKSTSSQLTDAINWAIAQNSDKNSPYYNKIDVNKIAASGMSCGGLQTLEVASDPRISTIVVCNSGIFKTPGNGKSAMPNLTKESLKEIHTPTLYLLGGESDIAYENGMDDYQQINHVPVFVANMDVGHGGTYGQPHGGEFAKVATVWYKWQLKGDSKAGKMFTGSPAGLSKNQHWRFEKKNMR